MALQRLAIVTARHPRGIFQRILFTGNRVPVSGGGLEALPGIHGAAFGIDVHFSDALFFVALKKTVNGGFRYSVPAGRPRKFRVLVAK